MTKKLLSVVLCIVMVLSIFTIIPFEFSAQETEIAQLGTSKTADQAINWVKSKVGTSVGYNDGSGEYQCVELIQEYYRQLGVNAVSGNGCDYAWNSLPSGWTRTAGGAPKKGDILVYTGGYGHVAIYESDYSFYQQNYKYHPYVEHSTFKYNDYNMMHVSYWGCIHPNFSTQLSKATLKMNKSIYIQGIEKVTISWNAVPGATHYNLWLYKENDKGEYTDYCSRNDNLTATSFEFTNLAPGNYKTYFQTYDSTRWMNDRSDWLHVQSDALYFSVVAPEKNKLTIEKNIFLSSESITITWEKISWATHYNLWLFKENDKGEYTDYCSRNDNLTATSFEFTNLAPGNYKTYFQTYSSNCWMPDNSDWYHIQSDALYFEVVETYEPESSYIIGDADGDKNVTIIDATLVQKWLARLVTTNEIDLAAADTDHDKYVTISDATKIQKFLAGIIEDL